MSDESQRKGSARTVLPVGTRVHHRGQLWTYGWTEDECKANPQWGWATVLEAEPQGDGTVEYRILKDAPMFEGHSREYWWASYHIDQHRPGAPVEASNV